MSNEKDIFDDLLKSQLNDLSGEVSFDDWEAVATKLDALEESKRAPLWWFWLAGIIAVGVITTLVVSPFGKQNSGDTTVAATQQVEGNNSNEREVINNIPTEAPLNDEADKSNQLETNENSSPNNEELVQQVKSDNGPGQTDNTNTTVDGSNPGSSQNEGQDSDGGDEGIQDSKSTTPETNESGSENDKSKDNKTLPRNNGDNNLPTQNKVDNKLGDSSSKGGRVPSFTTSNVKGKEKENTKKWELGFSASPNWASKIVTKNGAFKWRINKDYDRIAKSMENGGISYQLETRVNRYFGQFFYLTTGLGYSQVEENVDYNYIVKDFVSENIPLTQLDYVPRNPIAFDTVTYSGKNTYRFIEIPVRLGYETQIMRDKFSLRAEFGFKYMLLAGMEGRKTDVTSLALNDLSTVKNEYSLHNFGVTSSIGLFYNVNERFDFGVVPYYSLALSSIRNKEEGIQDRPFNTGLNIRVHHRIWSK